MKAGQKVGSFVLRNKMAEGGMGTIWAAEHTGLCRDVAVKFLSARVADNEAAVARFTHEARMLARINSPHTPQVFDHGVCEDGTPYIVMELISGVELGEWITEHGAMNVRQVRRLLAQVTLALTAAHDLGIVHRDIKPENIIISGGAEDFHVTLIDFGIAKSLLTRKAAAITQVGVTVGTPSYMSPEQIMGGAVDERADVWSLAVVAYWCLAGRLPFEGDLTGAIYLAIHQTALKRVTELRPELPADLDKWFDKALARDAADRFESARAMSEAFEDYTFMQSTWTEAIPLVKRTSVPSPRRRWSVIPYAACATVIGIVAAIGVRNAPRYLPSASAAVGQVGESLKSMVSRMGIDPASREPALPVYSTIRVNPPAATPRATSPESAPATSVAAPPLPQYRLQPARLSLHLSPASVVTAPDPVLVSQSIAGVTSADATANAEPRPE